MKDNLSILFLLLTFIVFAFFTCSFGVWLFSLIFHFTFTWVKALITFLVIGIFSGGIKIIVEH